MHTHRHTYAQKHVHMVNRLQSFDVGRDRTENEKYTTRDSGVVCYTGA